MLQKSVKSWCRTLAQELWAIKVNLCPDLCVKSEFFNFHVILPFLVTDNEASKSKKNLYTEIFEKTECYSKLSILGLD